MGANKAKDDNKKILDNDGKIKKLDMSSSLSIKEDMRKTETVVKSLRSILVSDMRDPSIHMLAKESDAEAIEEFIKDFVVLRINGFLFALRRSDFEMFRTLLFEL